MEKGRERRVGGKERERGMGGKERGIEEGGREREGEREGGGREQCTGLLIEKLVKLIENSNSNDIHRNYNEIYS